MDGEQFKRPENCCSICLGETTNTCYTNSCVHLFCYDCLKHWSTINSCCPLCKEHFRNIYHSFNDQGSFEEYEVPPTAASPLRPVPAAIPIGNTPYNITDTPYRIITITNSDSDINWPLDRDIIFHSVSETGINEVNILRPVSETDINEDVYFLRPVSDTDSNVENMSEVLDQASTSADIRGPLDRPNNRRSVQGNPDPDSSDSDVEMTGVFEPVPSTTPITIDLVNSCDSDVEATGVFEPAPSTMPITIMSSSSGTDLEVHHTRPVSLEVLERDQPSTSTGIRDLLDNRLPVPVLRAPITHYSSSTDDEFTLPPTNYGSSSQSIHARAENVSGRRKREVKRRKVKKRKNNVDNSQPSEIQITNRNQSSSELSS